MTETATIWGLLNSPSLVNAAVAFDIQSKSIHNRSESRVSQRSQTAFKQNILVKENKI